MPGRAYAGDYEGRGLYKERSRRLHIAAFVAWVSHENGLVAQPVGRSRSHPRKNPVAISPYL